MFARWRNLAAAAGAIWFPLASAQASPDRNELRYDSPCTRPGACAGYHGRAEVNPFQTFDRDSWYQQYYRNSLDDPTSISDQPENPPSYESNYTTGNDDEFSDQYIPGYSEPEFSTTDEPAAVLQPRIERAIPEVDADGRCSDPTCPCHDVIDLDSDDQPTRQDESSSGESARPADVNNSNRRTFDVYEPYSFEDEFYTEPTFDSAPVARLKGTIDPIFDECDEEAMNESFELFDESTIESGTLFDDGQSTATDELTGDYEEAVQGATDEFNETSAEPASRFHMFYPGCDWRAYQPGERPQPAAETDLNSDDFQEFTFEVD